MPNPLRAFYLPVFGSFFAKALAKLRLAIIVPAVAVFIFPADGAQLHLSFAHEGTKAADVKRLDYLVSGLALRRADGSWMESSREWAAYISDAGKTTADAGAIPAERFTAVRFRVGVDAKMNAADPNFIEAGHALHPTVNGLHWGWQGGYVFLALEGRRGDGGYSYHVAMDANLMTVELPVEINGAQPQTVKLSLDVARVLDGVKGDSTHSRDGDPLATQLKTNIERAFRVVEVKADVFQEIKVALTKSAPRVGTPFALEITERLPRVELPADNPLTVEGVALGRRLFHDTRFSRNNQQSCASCHAQPFAFSDARTVSAGAEGQKGRRNSMPLFNLAWAKEFFWDGRAKSLREQVLKPIEDPLEMNERLDNVLAKLRTDADYPREFAAAFGGEITSERLAMALEQFLLTLVSQDSKFDRAARKLATLNDEEKRGLQLFVTEHDPARGLRGADCFHCHGGNLFTSNAFANNGLAPSADLGRYEVTRDENDRGKFKAASLRNVAVTAPYMHDGRFATLEEVVEHYDKGVQRSAALDPNLAKHPAEGLGLSAEDKRALVAFLKTLTDEPFIAPPDKQTALVK